MATATRRTSTLKNVDHLTAFARAVETTIFVKNALPVQASARAARGIRRLPSQARRARG